jgi:hypothetical protein
MRRTMSATMSKLEAWDKTDPNVAVSDRIDALVKAVRWNVPFYWGRGAVTPALVVTWMLRDMSRA